MSKKKFKLVFGVDLDGVVADFYKRMREIAAEWYEKPLETMSPKITLGLKEWGISSKKEYQRLHRFAVTQRDLFKTVKPIKNAPQVLRRLSKADIRIRIITHRLYIPYFHKQAVLQTIEWLDYHGIPYWDLCFMAEKSAVGADIYIEDNPDNIAELKKDNHPTIIFSNPTNTKLQGPRGDDWNMVEKLIKKFAKTRKLE